MLADRGRSVHEIAAYGGHKSLRMVETYTKKRDELRLSRSAAKAFYEHETGTEVSTVTRNGDRKAKKRLPINAQNQARRSRKDSNLQPSA